MPVTTRSKRKTVDLGEIDEIPKKKFIKLIDITNKKNKSQIKQEKNQITSQKSDSVLYSLKPMISGESDVKSTSSSRLPAMSQTFQEFSTSTTQTSQPSMEEAIKIMKKVKKALKRGYSNVAERLQLDVVPECLFDIAKCHENHNSSKLPRKTSNDDNYLTKLYLTEDRHFQFCHHVRRNIVASKLNPGSDVCLSIIQEIMVSHKILDIFRL